MDKYLSQFYSVQLLEKIHEFLFVYKTEALPSVSLKFSRDYPLDDSTMAFILTGWKTKMLTVGNVL